MHACHAYMMVVGVSMWRYDACMLYIHDGSGYIHVEITCLHALHT